MQDNLTWINLGSKPVIFYGIVFGAQCYLPRLRFSKSESSNIIIMDLDREIGRIGGRNTKAPIEFFDLDPRDYSESMVE